MKHKSFSLLMALLMSMTANVASAYDAEIDGIYYNLYMNEYSLCHEEYAIVTYRDKEYNSYSGEVVIPESVEYNGKIYPVLIIGAGAFSGCSELTSLTIPSSVRFLSGFGDCSSLTSVHISDLAAWCSISFGSSSFHPYPQDNPLFIAKHLYLNGEEIKNLVIPENVTSISDYAFYGFKGITSVTIPGNVTRIGKSAFWGCSGLTSVTIPGSVTSICSLAFGGCDGLTSVTIPGSVSFIDEYGFSDCRSLTSVDISNGLTDLGRHAFYNCNSLASIALPESMTSIGRAAFAGTPWYDNQPEGLVYAGKVAYHYKGTMPTGAQITIKEGTLGIAENAFSGCSGLTSINIPSSVVSVGDAAFSATPWYDNQPEGLVYAGNVAYRYKGTMPSGTQITLKEGTSGIAVSAFRGCNGLTSVTIPNSVKSIGSQAFRNCNGLTSVTIPQGVTSIGKYTFSGCSELTSVAIPNSVTRIDSCAFSYCDGLQKVIVPDIAAWCGIEFIESGSNPLYYAQHIYSDEDTEITDLVIPDSVTRIGIDAFCYCTSLTSINIPNSVNSIGDAAFGGCSGLTSVSIPEGVTTIGNSAFSVCSGLTSVTIPNSVTTIGYHAFYGCSGLTSVTIPDSVSSIGTYAFYGCYFLKDKFVNKSSLVSSCNWGATLCDEETTDGLIIKEGAIIACRPWVTSVNIPEFVTSIGGRAFSDRTNLSSVTIGNSVISIEEGAFQECIGLTSVTFPESLMSIGERAFYGCVGLTSVTIPNSVTNIGNAAFQDCSGLISATIGNGITEISNSVFRNCSGLTSVIIGSGVTNISSSAFRNCSSLTSVTLNSDAIVSPRRNASESLVTVFGNQVKEYIIGDDVKTIGISAFNRCTGLTSVIISGSVTNVGASAFSNCTGLKEVYCYAVEIPKVSSSSFKDVNVSEVMLVVPDESVEKYMAHSVWGKFWIETPTDIRPSMPDKKIAMDIYNTDGHKLVTSQKGLNIIRYSDGTTKKVLIR